MTLCTNCWKRPQLANERGGICLECKIQRRITFYLEMDEEEPRPPK